MLYPPYPCLAGFLAVLISRVSFNPLFSAKKKVRTADLYNANVALPIMLSCNCIPMLKFCKQNGLKGTIHRPHGALLISKNI